jgi:hypothetical protein
MKANFKVNNQEWIGTKAQIEQLTAAAVTAEIRAAGKKAVDAANAQIHGAGFASRKWEIKAKFLPAPAGKPLEPAVWLHSTTNFEEVFTEGATIQAVKSSWLWLPMPSVPLWPGDSTRQMSPKKYIEAIGPLVLMWRKGRPPMLGAPVTGSLRPQPFGRFVTKARLKKGKLGRGPATIIPLFVGVPSVTIEKKFDVEGAVEKAAEAFPDVLVIDETI